MNVDSTQRMIDRTTQRLQDLGYISNKDQVFQPVEISDTGREPTKFSSRHAQQQLTPPTRERSQIYANRFNAETIDEFQHQKATLKQENLEKSHSPSPKKISSNEYNIESISRQRSPQSDVKENNSKRIYKRFDTTSSIKNSNSDIIREKSSDRKKVFIYEQKIPQMFTVSDSKERNKKLIEEMGQMEDFKNKEIGGMIGEFKSHWAKINGYLFFMNERLYDIYAKAESKSKKALKSGSGAKNDSESFKKELEEKKYGQWNWPSHGYDSAETQFKKFDLVLERLNLVESQWTLRPKNYEALLDEEQNMNEVLHQEVLELKEITKDTEKFYQDEFGKLHEKVYTLEREKYDLENQLREFRMKTDPLISKMRELKIENDKMKDMTNNFNKMEKNYNRDKVDLEITAVNYEKQYKDANLDLLEEKQKTLLINDLVVEQKAQLEKLFNEKLQGHQKILELNSQTFELSKNQDRKTIEHETLKRTYDYLKEKATHDVKSWIKEKQDLVEDLLTTKEKVFKNSDQLDKHKDELDIGKLIKNNAQAKPDTGDFDSKHIKDLGEAFKKMIPSAFGVNLGDKNPYSLETPEKKDCKDSKKTFDDELVDSAKNQLAVSKSIIDMCEKLNKGPQKNNKANDKKPPKNSQSHKPANLPRKKLEYPLEKKLDSPSSTQPNNRLKKDLDESDSKNDILDKTYYNQIEANIPEYKSEESDQNTNKILGSYGSGEVHEESKCDFDNTYKMVLNYLDQGNEASESNRYDAFKKKIPLSESVYYENKPKDVYNQFQAQSFQNDFSSPYDNETSHKKGKNPNEVPYEVNIIIHDQCLSDKKPNEKLNCREPEILNKNNGKYNQDIVIHNNSGKDQDKCIGDIDRSQNELIQLNSKLKCEMNSIDRKFLNESGKYTQSKDSPQNEISMSFNGNIAERKKIIIDDSQMSFQDHLSNSFKASDNLSVGRNSYESNRHSFKQSNYENDYNTGKSRKSSKFNHSDY